MPRRKVIYSVEVGEYSDYHIEAMFSTREKAQAYIDDQKWSIYDDPEIVEWEVDPVRRAPRPGYKWFDVVIALKTADIVRMWELEKQSQWGEAVTMRENFSNHSQLGPRFHAKIDGQWQLVSALVFNRLEAKDENHAAKIASERRTAWLLEHELGKDYNDEK